MNWTDHMKVLEVIEKNRLDKNPHAVSLGRKGGKASLKTMTKEQRSERARKAYLATKRAKKLAA